MFNRMSPEWKRVWYLLLTRMATVLVVGVFGADAVWLLLWLGIIKDEARRRGPEE